jgi:hypothetical protein
VGESGKLEKTEGGATRKLELLELVSAVDAMLLVSEETRLVVTDEEPTVDVPADCDGNDSGDLESIC